MRSVKQKSEIVIDALVSDVLTRSACENRGLWEADELRAIAI